MYEGGYLVVKNRELAIVLGMEEDVQRLHDELYWTPIIVTKEMRELDFFYVGDMENGRICSSFYVDRSKWLSPKTDSWLCQSCPLRPQDEGRCHDCLLAIPEITKTEELIEPITFTPECTIAFNKATTGIPHVLPMIMRAEACWLSLQSLEDLALGDYTRMVNEAIASYWQIREKSDFEQAVKRFEIFMNNEDTERAELKRG